MVANGDISIENAAIPKMNLVEISNLAEQFVLQYYTVMNQCPDMLHRFYSDDSMLVFESQPVTGQADIHNLLSKLNLKEAHVIILKVDALKSHQNSALVQVSGELSISGGPYRRFMRSFTLVEKDPSNFFVLADIFRFQDRVYLSEKKHTTNSAVREESESKHTGPKQTSKAPANGVPDKKPFPRVKQTESKAEEHFTRKPEAEPVSPKVPVESVPTKPPEKPAPEPAPLQPVPRQPEQVQTTSSTQNKPQQQQTQQQQQHQQQVAEQQPSAPMSWAQRASGNAASLPYAQTRVQATKPAAAEHPVSAGSTAQNTKIGNAPRPMRGGGGGFNNAGGPGRPQQQGPTNRDSGSEWIENNHGQTQQHGRGGGFGGSRGNMRGGNMGGSGIRGNRGGGVARGGNRGNAAGGAPSQRS
ncbi:hypothetical protein Aperf_G00000112923 [Anoplocephala perfoliata]